MDAIKRDDGMGDETQCWLERMAGRLGTGALALGSGVTTELIALEIAKALGVS